MQVWSVIMFILLSKISCRKDILRDKSLSQSPWILRNTILQGG
jgi:hypothetical protein